MRIVECEQGSEEWHEWRKRPTASEFHRFITPAKGTYSSQALGYAAEIVAQRLGVYEPLHDTYWMQWGREQEPNARHYYQQRVGVPVREVGFILPDHTDLYGGSPDGLIDRGMIEIKCPKATTLIQWHADGEVPLEYRPQIQGLLLISGCEWCDFIGFHPDITPFVKRIDVDYDYQKRIVACLDLLLADIHRISQRVERVQHDIVNFGTMRDDLRWDYE